MARGKSSKTSKILAFHKEGLSVNEIADKLKLTYTGVYSAIRRSGAVVKKAKGEKVISFAIGDPDMPTPHLTIPTQTG